MTYLQDQCDHFVAASVKDDNPNVQKILELGFFAGSATVSRALRNLINDDATKDEMIAFITDAMDELVQIAEKFKKADV